MVLSPFGHSSNSPSLLLLVLCSLTPQARIADPAFLMFLTHGAPPPSSPASKALSFC